MTQLDIFSVKYEDKLTPRQWKLYTFLKENNDKTFKNQEEILAAYENYLLQRGFNDNKYSYNYFEEKRANKHYSDMTSARNMRKDLRELRSNDQIQKIITKDKIANTYEEAVDYLTKKKIKALRELKLYWKEVHKLEKDQQRRLVFGEEREYIEALLKGERK